MENLEIFQILVLLFHCGEKAIPNIQAFPFGEIQTAPHFAQKALNNDVMF